MNYTATILSVATILLCAMNKGKMSGATVVIALDYSTDMNWFSDFIGLINHFMRRLLEVQKVFNLQECP